MSLVKIWSEFNKSAKIILVALVGVGAFGWWSSCGNKSKMEEWRDNYNEFVSKAAEETKRADSLKVVADSAIAVSDSAKTKAESLLTSVTNLEVQIKELQRPADSLAKITDATFLKLTQGRPMEQVLEKSPPAADPWIRLSFVQHEEILNLRLQNSLLVAAKDSLKKANTSLLTSVQSAKSAFEIERQRADSLQGVVNLIPPPPPKERFLGFIPLPSRKASLLIGMGLGVVGSQVVENLLNKP
jgi:hypothetical protein